MKVSAIVVIILSVLTACTDKKESGGTLPNRYVLQDFDRFQVDREPQWYADPAVDDGPYSEGGVYFKQQGINTPPATRGTFVLDDTFQIEIYTRDKYPLIFDYVDIVTDPDHVDNRVLKISTKAHTDGVILRPTKPLPSHYKLTYRIGYSSYGDATPANGYDGGDETGEPWVTASAVGHNGFYWLAILDQEPQPHNNIWMHHHRKFVIDTWDRGQFRNTVNVIASDGKSPTDERFGKQFLSFVGNEFKSVQNVPADYFLNDQWYQVTFIRTPKQYQFEIKGMFKNTGQYTYAGTINLAEKCVYHYNQTPEEMSPACADESWPLNSAYPEYFAIGEPHINFYEGHVLVDDVRLEYLE